MQSVIVIRANCSNYLNTHFVRNHGRTLFLFHDSDNQPNYTEFMIRTKQLPFLRSRMSRYGVQYLHDTLELRFSREVEKESNDLQIFN